MEELVANGYIIPDISYIWLQALHEGNPDVATFNELTAQRNQVDVV